MWHQLLICFILFHGHVFTLIACSNSPSVVSSDLVLIRHLFPFSSNIHFSTSLFQIVVTTYNLQNPIFLCLLETFSACTERFLHLDLPKPWFQRVHTENSEGVLLPCKRKLTVVPFLGRNAWFITPLHGDPFSFHQLSNKTKTAH